MTQVAQDKKEEKLSAFIQEVADRMPQDTKKILTPIKQGWNSHKHLSFPHLLIFYLLSCDCY